ncbi:MAG: NUDIX domain-containing protein [Patescibacteria group bacterium]|jgi:8-oxo-dGTP pyrophosphatase MutT (NUDIX family)
MSEKERFRPFAAAYLILIKDGQVLLSKRHNTGYLDGNYGLMSGHFDGGETAKQCIIREAKEEADTTLSPEDLEVIHVMHRLESDREYFDIYLKSEKWIGDITIMEPDKCSELKWNNIDDLPDNMVPEVKLALENINKGIHYGEFGWTA